MMTQAAFANDSWQTHRNARTLRAFMALRQVEIGERIAQLRRDRGNPPQEVVAQQIGVSYRSLQAWEAGDAKPSYRNLTKLADFFGVSEEFILMGEIDPSAPRNITQLDRIETEQRALHAKLDAILDRLDVKPETIAEIVSDFEREFDSQAEPPDGTERRRRDRRRA